MQERSRHFADGHVLEALKAVGLYDTVQDPCWAGTLWLPSDAAFVSALAALGWAPPGATPSAARADGAAAVPIAPDLLAEVLAYHVTPQVVAVADLADAETTLPTVQGSPLTVRLRPDAIGAEGVGSNVTVVKADVEACNAVAHLLDNVLLPMPLPAAAAARECAFSTVDAETLWDLLAEDPELAVFAAAANATGRAPVLRDPGTEATVFAPSNDACRRVLDAINATADALFEDYAALTTLVDYHLTGRVLGLADLTEGATVPSALMDGTELTITADEGGYTDEFPFFEPPSRTVAGANNAAEILGGGSACRGAVYKISDVLVPPP